MAEVLHGLAVLGTGICLIVLLRVAYDLVYRRDEIFDLYIRYRPPGLAVDLRTNTWIEMRNGRRVDADAERRHLRSNRDHEEQA